MNRYTMSCDDGFSVASRKRGEVVAMGQLHVWKEHGKKVPSAEMAKMVKTRKS